MNRITIALAALALVSLSSAGSGQEYQTGTIKVAEPWTRVAPKGAPAAGGYMAITNTGKEADTLIGGSVEIAKHFEVHEMKVEDGVMKMRALKPGLVIKAGETVLLKPGAYHAMFIELTGSPKAGSTVKGTLVFEKAGTIAIEYKVEPIGAQGSGGAKGKGHSGHSGH